MPNRSFKIKITGQYNQEITVEHPVFLIVDSKMKKLCEAAFLDARNRSANVFRLGAKDSFLRNTSLHLLANGMAKSSQQVVEEAIDDIIETKKWSLDQITQPELRLIFRTIFRKRLEEITVDEKLDLSRRILGTAVGLHEPKLKVVIEKMESGTCGFVASVTMGAKSSTAKSIYQRLVNLDAQYHDEIHVNVGLIKSRWADASNTFIHEASHAYTGTSDFGYYDQENNYYMDKDSLDEIRIESKEFRRNLFRNADSIGFLMYDWGGTTRY